MYGGAVFTKKLESMFNENYQPYAKFLVLAHEMGHLFGLQEDLYLHDSNRTYEYVGPLIWPPSSEETNYVDRISNATTWRTIMYCMSQGQDNFSNWYPNSYFYFCPPYSNTLLYEKICYIISYLSKYYIL